MSDEKPILRNIVTFGVSASTLGFLFLLAVVAARYLGPDDFGIFSFALAFVFFFDFLLDPGLYHLLIRQIARDKQQAQQYMLHAFAWKLVISPVVLLLIAVTIHFLHDSSRIRDAVYLIALASILKSAKEVYRSGLLAYERFDLEVLSAVIEKGGLFLIGSTVVMLGHGLYGLCWSFVGVRLIDLLVIRHLTKTAFHRSHGRIDIGFLVEMLKAGAPIGFYYVTLNVYNYIDTVMISVMRGSSEVGLYSASYKIYEGSLLVPVVIGTVLLPRLSLCHVSDTTAFASLVRTGWKYSLILALLATAIGVPIASDFTLLVFGGAYEESAIALQILLFGAAFAFMVNLLQTVMISIDQQRALLIYAMLGLGLNVLLNIFAIQEYGFAGAATVTVAVEAAVFGMLAYRLSKLAPAIRALSPLVKTVICWVIAGIFSIFFVPRAPSYLIACSWSVAFLVLLMASRVITGQERKLALNVFRRHSSEGKRS